MHYFLQIGLGLNHEQDMCFLMERYSANLWTALESCLSQDLWGNGLKHVPDEATCDIHPINLAKPYGRVGESRDSLIGIVW